MNEHDGYLLNNLYLARMALKIINNDFEQIKNEKCAKEIVALYLLIPYITNNTLDGKLGDEGFKIPKISSGGFALFIDNKPLSQKNLRDTLCHSTIFPYINGDNSQIIFDDRITMSQTEHNHKSENQSIPKGISLNSMVVHDEVLKFLLNLFDDAKNKCSSDEAIDEIDKLIACDLKRISFELNF